jgi:hypothetical protein
MENIEDKQTSTEAAGHIAGLGICAFSAACRGKDMSGAIIVLAGALLLLGGAFIAHGQTGMFVQVVGTILVAAGLVGWFFSTPKQ